MSLPLAIDFTSNVRAFRSRFTELAVARATTLLSLTIEKDENGVDHANASKPAPELAEEWNDSGQSITFKLRKNATFHDGAPVTAKDVKWSLDRASGAGGNPRFQMSTASLTDPKQFVVVDDREHAMEDGHRRQGHDQAAEQGFVVCIAHDSV